MSVHKFENIKSVLVVLSSKSMAFDMPALRNLITHAYPDAAVFFISPSGDALGTEPPVRVDLAIDFTPPHARQSFFFARSLKSRARNTVGRNAGWFFRKKNFTRVYDAQMDVSSGNMPKDYLESERYVQHKVLELAGVTVVKQGGVGLDRSKYIAQELPRI